ncbi:MAG: Putative NAD-dependent epimerase/dehydratase [uncultured Sulfurovum sp.]|uniref:NAD-dependent epimerase/dehydratase n=1 Tax=uncultured Sulfurovum sp. TaxID=269237 RepID=A0A6S6SR03_9BACT|nr:MAG: Putative NAD-dependent epimerase/dehydratase [uncultured Sulfurovum sp.]
MKILVIGATGFIGKGIYNFLKRGENEIVAGVRDVKSFDEVSINIDFTTLQDDKELVSKLTGFDVVVNAVGIIAETKTQSFEQMHTTAPIELFYACKEAKVKKVIHISALGTESGRTAYHKTKNRADEQLRALGLDYAILHPSIVYGNDGKSTALFQGLAALPLVPLVGDGTQVLQPIALEDLLLTVKKAIESDKKVIELDLVGAKSMTYKELLVGFRKWLGLKPAKFVSVPTLGTNVMGKILDEPTVSPDNIKMLNEGNVASVEPLKKFLTHTPVSMEERLFSVKASNAQKLFASLYFVRPLLRLVIGFVWIWSGIVSAFLYPQPLALELLHEIGVPVGLDVGLLYFASFLDIVIGVLTIMAYRLQDLLKLQLLVIGVYTLLLTFLAGHHWLHPFGPVLKNLPLMVSIFVLMKLEKFR